MNSSALLVLFLLNLLLVGRQERLKKSEMVRRLRGIITQLNGDFNSCLASLIHLEILFFYNFTFMVITPCNFCSSKWNRSKHNHGCMPLITVFYLFLRIFVRVYGWGQVVAISLPTSIHTNLLIMVPSLDIPWFSVGQLTSQPASGRWCHSFETWPGSICVP